MNMEEYYERELGEPWSALEARTRARHPEFFRIYDALKDEEPRHWWEFWK